MSRPWAATVLLGTIIIAAPAMAQTVLRLHQPYELTFTAASAIVDPFDTYLLRLEVTDPTGNVRLVDGFYDGLDDEPVWRARISPDRPGLWAWRTVDGDAPVSALTGLDGQFEVLDSDHRGGVVSDGGYFRFQHGGFVYLQGMFLDNRPATRWQQLRTLFSSELYPYPTTTHVYFGENLTSVERQHILDSQARMRVNKMNIYYANIGDYCGQPSCAVTPWRDLAVKERMDVARWREYDRLLAELSGHRMLASMWVFADDSNFDELTQSQRRKLLRYAMARHSAFNHISYTISLEWQEALSIDEVNDLGNFMQSHNPWNRMITVHSLAGCQWDFGDEDWASYAATQSDFSGSPQQNNDCARMRWRTDQPHLLEEFHRSDLDSDRGRQSMWAIFAGGVAGAGTGEGIPAFMRFLELSLIPHQRMQAANNVVEGGGDSRFALAENGHHYLVYTLAGSPFEIDITGDALTAYWYDPRDADSELLSIGPIPAGASILEPPSSGDWVLWITDGTNLNDGDLYISPSATMVREHVAAP